MTEKTFVFRRLKVLYVSLTLTYHSRSRKLATHMDYCLNDITLERYNQRNLMVNYHAYHFNRMIIPNALSFYLKRYYLVNKFLIDGVKKVSESNGLKCGNVGSRLKLNRDQC